MSDFEIIPERDHKPEQNGNEVNISEASLGFAELIYGVIFTPTATFRSISANPPLRHGFIAFFIIVALTSLVNIFLPPDFSKVPPEFREALVKAGPFIGLIGALLAFMSWFIQAGVFQLFAEFLGGKGRATGVLTVLALADIPRVLVIPFRVLGHFTATSVLGTFLTAAVGLGVFIWGVILLVIGLREIQEFSTGKAVATLLVPFGFAVLAVIIFLISFVGAVVPFANTAL